MHTPPTFWDYSNQIYGKGGIAQACLKLQDNHGLDVNLVLLCFWYGQYYGEFSNTVFNDCLTFSSFWSSNTVKPLRSIRTWLKDKGCEDEKQLYDRGDCLQFREKIKSVELEAEKIQQLTLEQIMVPKDQKLKKHNTDQEDIRKNFQHYLRSLDINNIDSINKEFEIILNADVTLR